MVNTAHHRRDAIEQRRRLHAQIARSRRRITGNTSRLVHGGCLPRSWRRQIQDHPVVALATAAGVGMLFAQVGSRTGAVSKIVDCLAQRLAGGTWTSLIKQFEAFFTAEDTSHPPVATEPDDG